MSGAGIAGVSIERDASCIVLRMQGEGKFNPGMLEQFGQALDDCAGNDAIQLLVLVGEGKNFSQGLDLDYLMSAKPEDAMSFVNRCMTVVGRMLTLPIPVAACVNGHAFGLGAMLCLASDYKVMREDRGFFCLPEIDMGMTLVASMNQLVLDKLPRALCRDVLLTGKRYGGEEALQAGIVDACCAEAQLLDTAKKLAEPMMGKNRNALSGLKRDLNKEILAVIDANRA